MNRLILAGVILIITALLVGCLHTLNERPIPPRTVYVEMNGLMTTESVSDIVKDLREADSNIIIIIAIQSPGGQIVALERLLYAYDHTKARDVIVEVNECAASAAAMFVEHVKHRKISPYSMLLYHQAKSCNGNVEDPKTVCTLIDTNSTDIFDRGTIALEKKMFAELMQQHILTEAEMALVMSGADVTITGEQFNKRTGA